MECPLCLLFVFKNAVFKVASVGVILRNLNNTNRNSDAYSRYQENWRSVLRAWSRAQRSEWFLFIVIMIRCSMVSRHHRLEEYTASVFRPQYFLMIRSNSESYRIQVKMWYLKSSLRWIRRWWPCRSRHRIIWSFYVKDGGSISPRKVGAHRWEYRISKTSKPHFVEIHLV